MLHPDVVPQLTIQLFSNTDYQFEEKDEKALKDDDKDGDEDNSQNEED